MDQQMMQRCLENCTRCHTVCTRTIQHCLTMGGAHAAADHVRLMLDCAEICQTSANFLARSSPLHTETCRACGEICERCADDCERVGGGKDLAMQECVDACRRCAESCRAMSGAAVA